MTLREASPLTHENVAMIAGATGQGGAYLAELSLNKGHVVHGVKRRSSSVDAVRVYHLYYYPRSETEVMRATSSRAMWLILQ